MIDISAMDTSRWSPLRIRLFLESQCHREHSEEIAAWYNSRPTPEQWHLSRFVNHYICSVRNLEDMALHIDTVSTQFVALCARSMIENYLILHYLHADPHGTAQSEYDAAALAGSKEATHAIVAFLVREGRMTESEAGQRRQDTEQLLAQKQVELNIPELPKKSDINFKRWAESIGVPNLVHDYDQVHKFTSKYVHPTPMSSVLMQPEVEGRPLLHAIFGNTALRYGRMIQDLVDSVLKPQS